MSKLSKHEQIHSLFVDGLSAVKMELPIANNNLITIPNIEIDNLKCQFMDTSISNDSITYDEYYKILHNKVLPYIVNVSSPQFIGHMTSVLPKFNYDLSKLISMLNQNMVKIETSKSLTFLEREALAMLHREFYGYSHEFYKAHVQNAMSTLGIVVSGGTMANITALWAARNALFPATNKFKGIAVEGLKKAFEYYECDECVVLVSPLLHYSIEKAASILGIGKQQIYSIPVTSEGIVDVEALQLQIENCEKNKQKVIAIIGIAGATENGCVDPLYAMADIADKYNIHFHVDAAFGGALIFSDKYKHLLYGIERADSITLCGHKQLYLPIGISMCLFKIHNKAHAIYNTADYQATKESFDFGKSSPEGSRAANSMYLHASLHIIGKTGYEYLINKGMENAGYLKTLILDYPEFELITTSMLNIVNYRYIPKRFRSKVINGNITCEENKQIDHANALLQTQQFENGATFMSKTRVLYSKYSEEILILRAVLINPLTTFQDIEVVLVDQLRIANKIIEEEPMAC